MTKTFPPLLTNDDKQFVNGQSVNVQKKKRAARIELASLAWNAKVLPLNYARKSGVFFTP